MRHFTLRNFRGLEFYADSVDLDRGSLRKAQNVLCQPRGALSNGVIWRGGPLPGAGAGAFNKRLDYLDTAAANSTPGNYLRSREDFPIDVNISTMSNKGALFMAGDSSHPNRVWIAEAPHKRENVVTGIESAQFSYVDIINVGPSSGVPTVRALSNYGPYIYAHHEYGVTALYDVEGSNDPVTGFRVRQTHTPVPVGLANHACAAGDVWLGYDGQLWDERIESGPPEKYEGQPDPQRVPSYKSTGGYEHLLADGWQDTAVAEWLPKPGYYVFFVDLASGDRGMFLYDRPNLTLTGPHTCGPVADVVNPLGTEYLFVRFSDDSLGYADLAELREKELTQFQLPVDAPAIMGRDSYQSEVEFNWEDLGNPNTHKSFDEVQLNFQYGSQGRVAIELENERGQVSGSRHNWQDFSLNQERAKFFVNLNGRRYKLRLYFDNFNGMAWVLRDLSVGFTPGVEL